MQKRWNKAPKGRRISHNGLLNQNRGRWMTCQFSLLRHRAPVPSSCGTRQISTPNRLTGMYLYQKELSPFWHGFRPCRACILMDLRVHVPMEIVPFDPSTSTRETWEPNLPVPLVSFETNSKVKKSSQSWSRYDKGSPTLWWELTSLQQNSFSTDKEQISTVATQF